MIGHGTPTFFVRSDPEHVRKVIQKRRELCVGEDFRIDCTDRARMDCGFRVVPKRSTSSCR